MSKFLKIQQVPRSQSKISGGGKAITLPVTPQQEQEDNGKFSYEKMRRNFMGQDSNSTKQVKVKIHTQGNSISSNVFNEMKNSNSQHRGVTFNQHIPVTRKPHATQRIMPSSQQCSSASKIVKKQNDNINQKIFNNFINGSQSRGSSNGSKKSNLIVKSQKKNQIPNQGINNKMNFRSSTPDQPQNQDQRYQITSILKTIDSKQQQKLNKTPIPGQKELKSSATVMGIINPTKLKIKNMSNNNRTGSIQVGNLTASTQNIKIPNSSKFIKKTENSVSGKSNLTEKRVTQRKFIEEEYGINEKHTGPSFHNNTSLSQYSKGSMDQAKWSQNAQNLFEVQEVGIAGHSRNISGNSQTIQNISAINRNTDLSNVSNPYLKTEANLQTLSQFTQQNVASAYIQLSSENSKMDAENVKTLQKNKLLSSITEFKGKMNSSQIINQSEDDYSQNSSENLEENTFTRKMTDASAQEIKLMKKLDISMRENEHLIKMVKQSEQENMKKTIENQNVTQLVENCVFPMLVDVLKNNNGYTDNEWKNVIRIIGTNVLGHTPQELEVTIQDIEKSRKNESLLSMENHALQIKNEGLCAINNIEKQKSQILLQHIEKLEQMSSAMNQTCMAESQLASSSSVLKALQGNKPKSEFLQKIQKFQDKIEMLEDSLQQKHDFMQDQVVQKQFQQRTSTIRLPRQANTPFENTNVSFSDISSNTELESNKFKAVNHKINMNQMRGMQFYQQQLDHQKKSTSHLVKRNKF